MATATAVTGTPDGIYFHGLQNQSGEKTSLQLESRLCKGTVVFFHLCDPERMKDPLIPVHGNRGEEYNAVTGDEFRQWPNREEEELMGKTNSVFMQNLSK